MHSRGFTMLEVVLAIGLSGAVLALLATAIDLYLVRVDTSRTQVESAQLARTLLNQIAADLQAARYFAPTATSTAESGTSAPVDSALVKGVFGTATELRIDRSAVWQWEDLARQMDLENTYQTEATTPLERFMPLTVRYVLGEGQELLTADLAKQGVSESPLAQGHAGLYRQQVSTSAWMNQDSAQSNGSVGAMSNEVGSAELIAPEVVDITFAYYDGSQLLDEWDSGLAEELPAAVEIRLTLLKEPFEQAIQHSRDQRDELRRHRENLVEYRRFVRLPGVSQPQEASFPQPQPQSSTGPTRP